MVTKAQEKERQEAIEALREQLKPGTVVYTDLRHVSKSGMTRDISVHVVDDGQITDISWRVARALNERMNQDHGGLRVGGCGMDMGYHIVHNLGYALYPKGFDCTGKNGHGQNRCPSNDHSNGDRQYKGQLHSSGGYAFHHRWI